MIFATVQIARHGTAVPAYSQDAARLKAARDGRVAL